MAAKRPLIVEAFENLIALPENKGRRIELINGEIVEEITNPLHSLIMALLAGILGKYLDDHPIGWAFLAVGITFPDDPLNHLIPDVAVALAENHNILTDDLNEPFTTMPELIVEIQSPGQSDQFMIDKADVYLAYGAHISIIVYPLLRAVDVRRPGSNRRFFEGESIDLSDLLPGLITPVSKIFPQFDKP